MNDNRKRKREDEQEVYYQPHNPQNVQIVSSPNGAIDLNQPLFLNQLPVIQNQQLVYQIPQVQGVSPGNNAQDTYYIFVPVAETPEGQIVKEDNDLKAGQYVTYRTIGNDVKTSNNSVITIDGIKQDKVYEPNPPKITAPPVHHMQQQRPNQVYEVEKTYPAPPPACQMPQGQMTSNNAQNSAKWKNQLYRCEHLGCEEKFSSLHEKKIHLETHLFPESEQFKCSICNMVFKKAIDRNKHIETHSIVSTHRCKHCQKSFPYYTTLVAHVEEAFTVEQFTCYFCERHFDDTVTFLRHNGWSMKTCKCGAKMCGDMVYQKHLNMCTEGATVNVKNK